MNIGILAYGSLIGDPGREIKDAITGITRDVQTPFNVEFARSSKSRGGAPALVPVDSGGASVAAFIYRLNTSEQLATDMLYRRELHEVGSSRTYQEPPVGRANAVRVVRLVDFAGYDVVLSTKIGANVSPLTAERLAQLAIASAARLDNGKDGISYLIAAKENGIRTALSAAYEMEILRQLGVDDLPAALAAARQAGEHEVGIV